MYIYLSIQRPNKIVTEYHTETMILNESYNLSVHIFNLEILKCYIQDVAIKKKWLSFIENLPNDEWWYKIFTYVEVFSTTL